MFNWRRCWPLKSSSAKKTLVGSFSSTAFGYLHWLTCRRTRHCSKHFLAWYRHGSLAQLNDSLPKTSNDNTWHSHYQTWRNSISRRPFRFSTYLCTRNSLKVNLRLKNHKKAQKSNWRKYLRALWNIVLNNRKMPKNQKHHLQAHRIQCTSLL